jgi:hypothetical protein
MGEIDVEVVFNGQPTRAFCGSRTKLRVIGEEAALATGNVGLPLKAWDVRCVCGAQLRWDDAWSAAMGSRAQGHARSCKRSSPVLYVNLFPGVGG